MSVVLLLVMIVILLGFLYLGVTLHRENEEFKRRQDQAIADIYRRDRPFILPIEEQKEDEAA